MREATKKKIIKVAHKIFADKGITKATMVDIAKASGIGRRTLYTYFETREDLYCTVVKKEIDDIIKKMHEVVKDRLSPEKKLMRFVLTHMEAVQDLTRRNRYLKLDFLTKNERIEKLRRDLDKQEKIYITAILMEGKSNGSFTIEDPENVASIAHTTMKGLEMQFIMDNFGEGCTKTLKLFQKILFKGILPGSKG